MGIHNLARRRDMTNGHHRCPPATNCHLSAPIWRNDPTKPRHMKRPCLCIRDGVGEASKPKATCRPRSRLKAKRSHIWCQAHILGLFLAEHNSQDQTTSNEQGTTFRSNSSRCRGPSRKSSGSGELGEPPTGPALHTPRHTPRTCSHLRVWSSLVFPRVECCPYLRVRSSFVQVHHTACYHRPSRATMMTFGSGQLNNSQRGCMAPWSTRKRIWSSVPPEVALEMAHAASCSQV